jgi:hypothetical protein
MSDGRPSVLLVGAFVLDSVALVAIAWALGPGRKGRPR